MKTLIKRIAVCSFTIIFAFGFIRSASAHLYETDGSVTVLLHSNPDDDPIVGAAAALFFQIDDTANRFDQAQCDCSVEISKQGKKLFSSSLLRIGGASIYAYTVPFTFPEKAVYSIVVTGKPKESELFQDFQVKYDLRVDRDQGQEATPATNSTSGRSAKLIAIIAVGFVVLAGLVIFFKSKRKSKQ
ncbi:MAG: hypothetical protein ABI643_01865 [Candidatus Doudnabacteria bacterium]